MNSNVLVTGGAGYIGSHACKSISKIGLIPVTVDNLVTGWKDAVKYGPFEYADLLDRSSIDLIFKKYKPIAVMHFAAYAKVTESIKNPGIYWRNNVMGSLNLIETSIEHNCLDFIFSSTCATYGDYNDNILSETSYQKPTNPYGQSKLAIEKIVKNFSTSAGLRNIIFRYFNVAGADQDSEIGEFHKPETHLIPLILEQVQNPNSSITIFGTDYNTPDGTCIRDYVHVCDLVDAHVLGLKWLQSGGKNSVYNLGTNDGFSVREVINSVEQVTQKKINIVEGKRRLGDSPKLVSSSNLARKELGWNPYRSNLKKIITDSWHWHQKKNYIN